MGSLGAHVGGLGGALGLIREALGGLGAHFLGLGAPFWLGGICFEFGPKSVTFTKTNVFLVFFNDFKDLRGHV